MKTEFTKDTTTQHNMVTADVRSFLMALATRRTHTPWKS